MNEESRASRSVKDIPVTFWWSFKVAVRVSPSPLGILGPLDLNQNHTSPALPSLISALQPPR